MAAVLISLVRLCLAVLPFRVVLRLMRRFAQPRSGAYAARLDSTTIVWAVEAVGRRLVRRNPCLTQALVVLLLFRRRGYPARLRIGVSRDESPWLHAHAWVESKGRIVIGGAASPSRYVPLPAVEGDHK